MIKTRIQNINRLIESVKDHCMCAKLEDDGAMYRVIYPEGVQCSQRIGKSAALEKILVVMERHWKESMIAFRLTDSLPDLNPATLRPHPCGNLCLCL